jgi:hypothetical protein
MKIIDVSLCPKGIFHDHTQLQTPHVVGLLWTSDQPDAIDSYLTTCDTHKRHFSDADGSRTHNPSKRTAADPRIRPRGPLGSAVIVDIPDSLR